MILPLLFPESFLGASNVAEMFWKGMHCEFLEPMTWIDWWRSRQRGPSCPRREGGGDNEAPRVAIFRIRTSVEGMASNCTWKRGFFAYLDLPVLGVDGDVLSGADQVGLGEEHWQALNSNNRIKTYPATDRPWCEVVLVQSKLFTESNSIRVLLRVFEYVTYVQDYNNRGESV